MDLREQEGRAPAALPSRDQRFGAGFWMRLAGVAILDALAVWTFPTLIDNDAWPALAALVIGVLAVNWIYFSRPAYPFRYMVPGLVFLVLFMLYPIGYTVYLTLTNFQIGNIGSQEQAIDFLTSESYIVPEDAETLQLEVYRNAVDELLFFTVSPGGEQCVGAPRLRSEEPGDPAACEPFGGTVPEQIDDFTLIPSLGRLQLGDLSDFVVDLPDGQAQVVTTTTALVAIPKYAYDTARGVLVDNLNNVVCEPFEGNFVCDGQAINPGWREVIGGDNYADVATDPRVRGPLFRVFAWNLAFAFLAVGLQLAVGLGLALTFQEARLRFRRTFRSVLILPYAIPAFISVLVWRGLLDDQFGKVNELLSPILSLFGSDGIPWLTQGWAARVAVILVVVWQGFPYMMIICMGALQAIPMELVEAARVDGASALTVFRRVTFPLLMVIIAPLLVASFGFNFNNFILPFFLTGGGPPVFGYDVPVGETDLLISFTYTLATGGGGKYALAATFSIFIFAIVVIISAIGFRYTKRLEDIYGSL
jgi:ABC-type sugar transport system permease subunit